VAQKNQLNWRRQETTGSHQKGRKRRLYVIFSDQRRVSHSRCGSNSAGQKTRSATTVAPGTAACGEELPDILLLLPTGGYHAEHPLHKPTACRAVCSAAAFLPQHPLPQRPFGAVAGRFDAFHPDESPQGGFVPQRFAAGGGESRANESNGHDIVNGGGSVAIVVTGEKNVDFVARLLTLAQTHGTLARAMQ
jgi:hypothetical protein